MKKLLVLLVLLLAACAPAKPEPLRYVIIPSEGTERPEEQFAPFVALLMPVFEIFELMVVPRSVAGVSSLPSSAAARQISNHENPVSDTPERLNLNASLPHSSVTPLARGHRVVSIHASTCPPAIGTLLVLAHCHAPSSAR